MREIVLVDTGPLVAWLIASDSQHAWAVAQFARLPPPLLTCEAVLSEAAHLIEYHGGEPAVVLDLVARGVFRVPQQIERDSRVLSVLLRRYRNVPMSLADACLVRLSELHDPSAVLTLDSDFRIYRRHGRSLIPLIMPAKL